LVGKMDPAVSLSVTFGLLAAGVIVSLLRTRGDETRQTRPAAVE
jgi:tellurite resistance protein TerC